MRDPGTSLDLACFMPIMKTYQLTEDDLSELSSYMREAYSELQNGDTGPALGALMLAFLKIEGIRAEEQTNEQNSVWPQAHALN
ncbi:MAG: hypothetical protein MI753_13740 [Hyphomicrobiales bacterium]|nr:hypothetical protein [Hyphomicrobiales bacterium]